MLWWDLGQEFFLSLSWSESFYISKERSVDKTIEVKPGDSFVVTGVYYNSSKRFEPIHSETFWYANAINLWKGSVWLVRNGKRILIKRVGW